MVIQLGNQGALDQWCTYLFLVGTNKVYCLDVSCKTKRRVKMFGLSNWKNGVLVNWHVGGTGVVGAFKILFAHV